ncbi:EAL domain-containing protein [Marinobacter sp. 1Y8]
MFKRFSANHSGKTLLAILLAGSFYLLLSWTGSLDRPEAGIRDRIIAVIMGEVASDLVILEIDSASIDAIGQWPWPREVYARAITALGDAGIRSLMIDVDFSARSNPADDARLADAIHTLSRTVPIKMPVFVQRRSQNDTELMLRHPMPALANNAELVSVNMYPEGDGLVRFLSAGFSWEGVFYPGVWNALADQSDTSTWIDYSISPRSFDYISLTDLLNDKVPPRKLRGKDVMLGSTAIELGDNLATPIHKVLPGVVIQALGTQTLRQGGLFQLSDVVSGLVLIVFWLASALIFNRWSWYRSLQGLAIVAAVWLCLFLVVYVKAHLVIDVFKPVFLSTMVYVAVCLAKLDTATLERLWLQISLHDNEALLDRIVTTTNDYILCTDQNGTITRANKAFQMLCEMPEDALMDTPLAQRLPDAEKGLFNLPLKPFDTTLLNQDGTAIPVEATISRLDLSSDPVFTIVLRDLRERLAREQELAYQATHDTLTGLLNRSAFFSHVNDNLKHHTTGCLISLDLDYFKEVNDAYGHQVGDRLLTAVAERIEDQTGQLGYSARIGGDGFAIWLSGLRFASGGRQFCEHLLTILEAPFAVDGGDYSIQISGTLGVAEPVEVDGACSETRAPDMAERLLRQSADAMRLGKAEGVAVRCYNEADSKAAVRRLEMVPAIRTHIRNDAFELFYQPKLALDTLRPVGSEALLRWPSNDREFVPVTTLIEVAENSRQIVPLTRWVVDTILEQESEWERLGRPRQIAINLSARLFHDRNFFAGLRELLQARKGYFQVEFEITETALLGNEKLALELINELIENGATLAIDDYGTGYSSLTYLQDLNASVLKIDKSFVSNIETAPSNQVIVRSTINMAHDLGLKVVAEGVESLSDEVFLKQAGCDLAQGYHYARPMPLEQFDQWLAEWPAK